MKMHYTPLQKTEISMDRLYFLSLERILEIIATKSRFAFAVFP